MRALVALLLLVTWISGIVIANGFWSTLFAVIIPLWGYYLVIERILITNGII